jgi:hypothetical protein
MNGWVRRAGASSKTVEVIDIRFWTSMSFLSSNANIYSLMKMFFTRPSFFEAETWLGFEKQVILFSHRSPETSSPLNDEVRM